MIYFIDPTTLMNLSFIPDAIDQTKPCKGSNKAEGGVGFWKILSASEKMRRKEQDWHYAG